MLADYLSAGLAWTLYYAFRKLYLEPLRFGQEVPLEFNETFYLGFTLIPVFWIVLYHISGAYFDVYRKSRLGVLGTTLLVSVLGSIILFFAVSLDDFILSYRYYYWSFGALFTLHFSITALQRIVIGTLKSRRIQTGKVQFNTILVGSGPKAWEIFKTIEQQSVRSGNRFIGFVPVNGSDCEELKKALPCIGQFSDMVNLIKEKDVEEVIVAPENSEHKYLGKFLTELEVTNAIIKVIPDITDFLLGSVKMSAIFGAPVIELRRQLMPQWQKSLKRLFDITVSILVLTLLSPVYLITALIVVTTSKGPALYSHFRVGLNGKSFRIYKFRSMYSDAESRGPMLSSKHDSRITPFGRFMRKTRLDEIPQFYNVLVGTMSIVGPRPERQFYIDQIVEVAPHYRLLHKVRPGITGWGQVKFGYAENIDEMVERLKYDILYIENMTIALDLKILIYTFLIVLQGRGK
ncbi:MAG: sugar transferase [Bacteroidetes bacterium]|nr:sugar transferase [Bacteroidota bacterium]